ncbi:MAG TPA: UDP-N-acetylmuramoyl-tripeptide--D-alanyl-D-alanine ligase [Armatimonadota bacterium]|nr:UDP-N-acetylmuramoyl-tripeptide--D-alanyl-D-alanine ligase [Armatimonadota bacterium]
MLDYPLDLLARVLEASRPAGGDRLVRRVCTDSRKVEPGDLFFALSGENFDGHEFVASAFDRGAVGAVVRKGRIPVKSAPGPLLAVSDPLLALGTLGGWHRSRFPVRVVAVTGSVGKTTTKDLIHAVLSQQWTTLKSPGNLNAEIGLPLTLLELRPHHETAVVELAMRGTGQIRYLARLARPEVAVITNIGLSHLELLGSQDAIAAAKGEVLEFLPHGGVAVLNAEDRYFQYLSGLVPPGVRIMPYGLDRPEREATSGMYLGSASAPGEREGEGVVGGRFMLRGSGERTVRPAWIPLLGTHNVRNALAAAAVGQAMGVSAPRITRGLARAEISAMRMAIHRLRDGTTVLDDAYNASTPEAMISALEVLREMPALRKTAVLGNMLELGAATEEAHRKVGEAVARVAPGLLITVGEHARLIAQEAIACGLPAERVAICRTNDDAWNTLRELRRSGDVMLVKGSRGMQMESLIGQLTTDREV